MRNLGNIMLTEVSQTPQHQYKRPKAVKFTETGNRIVVARDWRGGRGSQCSTGTESLFGKMEMPGDKER